MILLSSTILLLLCNSISIITSSILVDSHNYNTINNNRILKTDGKGGNNGKGGVGNNKGGGGPELYNKGGGGPELYNKGQQYKTATEPQQYAYSSANKIGKGVKSDKGGGGYMSENQKVGLQSNEKGTYKTEYNHGIYEMDKEVKGSTKSELKDYYECSGSKDSKEEESDYSESVSSSEEDDYSYSGSEEDE